MVPPDHFLYLRIYHIITIAYLPLTVSSRFYGAFRVIPKNSPEPCRSGHPDPLLSCPFSHCIFKNPPKPGNFICFPYGFERFLSWTDAKLGRCQCEADAGNDRIFLLVNPRDVFELIRSWMDPDNKTTCRVHPLDFR